MKNIFFIAFLFVLFACLEQSRTQKIIINNTKNDTMPILDMNYYKGWDNDERFTSTETRKFLKKGNIRVEINMFKDGTVLRETSTTSPYTTIKAYYPDNKLNYNGVDFYSMHIGVWKYYNEKSQLIKEKNWDSFYKVPLKDVIEIVKLKYGVNLENKSQGGEVNRAEDYNNGTLFYAVSFKSKENDLKRNYILISGSTGDIVFTSSYYIKGDFKNPFDEYLGSKKH